VLGFLKKELLISILIIGNQFQKVYQKPLSKLENATKNLLLKSALKNMLLKSVIEN
jgi:hypothetical protein